jgi:Ca2+-binding EF-hand superfamily protein
LKKFGINFGLSFDTFDTNKNGRLSAHELAEAIQLHLKTELKPEEVTILRDFFKNRFNNNDQVNRAQFVKLMETDFKNSYDEQ